MTRSSEDGGMNFMDVNEQGIINAFDDYFENFETDSHVITGEEARKFIRAMLDEYRIKYNSELYSGGGQPEKSSRNIKRTGDVKKAVRKNK